MILWKVTTGKNVCFPPIGFLIMDSTFKVMYVWWLGNVSVNIAIIHSWHVPEGDIQCESVYALLINNKKFYLQIYLDSCAYKTVNKQMTDYLAENLFED